MSLTTTNHPDPAQSHESAVRDALARDRTRLANERTFLAYIRTSLAFFAAGASLIRFFDSDWAHLTGYGLLAFGSLVIIAGARSYGKTRRCIATPERKSVPRR